MEKYLGLKPGSVSPFGLIHDKEKNVHLFLDRNLGQLPRISFHPNNNAATLVVDYKDFNRFIESCGNTWESLDLYDQA